LRVARATTYYAASEGQLENCALNFRRSPAKPAGHKNAVRTCDSEPLLHTHFVEQIAADLGFILLSNGDFRASRNHGNGCRPGCPFERTGNNHLIQGAQVQFGNPGEEFVDLSLFVSVNGVDSDLRPRRT
jgi:hypothetical protein